MVPWWGSELPTYTPMIQLRKWRDWIQLEVEFIRGLEGAVFDEMELL